MKWSNAIFCFVAFSVNSQSIQFTHQQTNIPSSIRGLSVVDDQVAWLSGTMGYVGRTVDGGVTWKHIQVESFDSVDFRSLYAFDSLRAVIANAGSPANILKTSDGGKTWRVVYENRNPDIFFDGIDFWDDQSGLIYGDPIGGKMMLLKTQDGGLTWNEILPWQRPILEIGEASFAASGTGIRCYNKKDVLITTGGKVSRVWASDDRGEHWSSNKTSIIQGKSSSGIFSIGVANNIWTIVGGDYLADSISINNSFYSLDTGHNWIAPKTSTRGFRSCVEFLDKNIWIAVGQGGFDLSYDNGRNWFPVSDEKGFHVVRKARTGNKIITAGRNSVSVLELKK